MIFFFLLLGNNGQPTKKFLYKQFSNKNKKTKIYRLSSLKYLKNKRIYLIPTAAMYIIALTNDNILVVP